MSEPLIQFTPEGIYCPRAGLHIDPWRPVPRAVITHAHSDHARPGMGAYLATPMTAAVMRHRLGAVAQELDFGGRLEVNGVEVSFHPAGHLPGSAQVRLAHRGEVWVISGDYKPEPDGLAEGFEPVPCQHFITESTFGLPVFRWPDQRDVAGEILRWWQGCAARGVTPMLGAYALGKAQRLMHMLAEAAGGAEALPGPILTHAAVENTNAVLRGAGLALPPSQPVGSDPAGAAGGLVIAPPSALGSKWARQFGEVETGFASGWMALRGIRRRRGMGRGFVVSDHADFSGLLRAIRWTGAENIYVTHGYKDIFTRYLNECGWSAQVLQTEFGDADEGEADADSALS